MFRCRIYVLKLTGKQTFLMFDHGVPWARAASWFNSQSWPRTGVEFDNFMSIGLYRSKDGSHLCHHGTCISQHHVFYEDSGINAGRNRCCCGAQEMRSLGVEIPKHCTRHDPPCLLQVRAPIDSLDKETDLALACRVDRLRVISDSILHFPLGERPSIDPRAGINASGSSLFDV